MSIPIKAEDAIINFAVENESGTVIIDNGHTQGNYNTPSDHLGNIQGDVELPDPEYDYEEEYFVGAGRTAADKFKGQKVLEGGSIPLKPVDAKPFALLLGAEEYSNNTHTLTIPEPGELPTSFSLGVDYQNHDLTRVFTGSVAGSGEISVSEDSELEVTLDVDALDVGTDSVGFDISDYDSNDYLPNKNTWSFENISSDLTIFNKSIASLGEFNLEINQNTSTEYYVTSESDDGPYEILYGRPQLNLNTTITIRDSDIYSELIDSDVSFTTEIEFDNGDATLHIELEGCDIASAPHGLPEEGKVESDVEIIAEDITITVTDTNSDGAVL